MSSLERARELAGLVTGLLAGAVADVHVTTDVLEIRNALASDMACVAVLPPKLEFPTVANTAYEWTLFATAGPIQDQVAAWATLDAITFALKDALSIEQAEPDVYQFGDAAPAYAAYALTFTETI